MPSTTEPATVTERDTILPLVTVVVPIRNEERFIESTLRQILDQDYDPSRFEVIVADGMSGDSTREIVHRLERSHANLRMFDNPRKLSSHGRNIGFKQGRGDVFLVVDGHCHIGSRQMLRSIAECFAASRAECLGRPQPLTPPDINDFQRIVAAARASWLGHGADSLIYDTSFEGTCDPTSNGAIYRRSVFEKVGYVDERFDACEDLEFNHRIHLAGIRAYSSPRLTVYYYPRATIGGLFHQMERYGRGRYRFALKHPATRTLKSLIPLFFAVGLLTLACTVAFVVALPGLWYLCLPVWAGFGMYAALTLREGARMARTCGLRAMALSPVIFGVIHAGLGAGYLAEMFRRGINARRNFELEATTHP